MRSDEDGEEKMGLVGRDTNRRLSVYCELDDRAVLLLPIYRSGTTGDGVLFTLRTLDAPNRGSGRRYELPGFATTVGIWSLADARNPQDRERERGFGIQPMKNPYSQNPTGRDSEYIA